MTVLNDLDRFHLVMSAIDRLPQTGRQWYEVGLGFRAAFCCVP
jgi:phosphoketolase